MSKEIIIKEGGTAKQFDTDKLETNIAAGGTCLWVPEDETQVGEITITKNGVYNAADDGLYGYYKVTVNGIGYAVGLDSDGDEAMTYSDDGELVTEKIPSSIDIDTPPTKTEYYDGDTIDYSGIVVKAYLESGGLWTDDEHPDGIIPIEELILTVETASDQTGEATATSDLYCGIRKPFPFADSVYVRTGIRRKNYNDENYAELRFTGARFAVAWNEGGGFRIIGATDEANKSYTYTETIIYTKGLPSRTETRTTSMRLSYTNGGKTVYYAGASFGYGMAGGLEEVKPVSTVQMEDLFGYKEQIAWTMVYGEISGFENLIPVGWPRPGDYKTLEDSFQITVNVAPAPTGGTPGGGAD